MMSSRLKNVKPSSTLAISQKIKDLKSRGHNIISMNLGEPDFDTPVNIKNAAIKAIDDGQTKYTDNTGTPELKKAIIHKLRHHNNLEYNENEIIVSTGCKQVIYNLFQATIEPDDEVIIPAPYWVSYPDIVALSGGTSKVLECHESNGFKLRASDLSEAITPRTKWIILNHPNNPTGSCYSKGELLELAEVIRQHSHVMVMCDDIYEHLVYDNFSFKTMAEVAPDLKDRIFIVNGVSKAYAMTGWRIGYGAGPSELISNMGKIQSHSTSNPCSIAQAATVEALMGTTPDYFSRIRHILVDRRNELVNGLNSITGITCYLSEGSFYLFPSCHEFYDFMAPTGLIIKDSDDFADYLLSEVGVAVVSGKAFGMDGYFRVSYTISKDLIINALERIKIACSQLKTLHSGLNGK